MASRQVLDDNDNTARRWISRVWRTVHRGGRLPGEILGLAALVLLVCILVAGLGVAIAALYGNGGGTTATEVTQRQSASFDVGFRPSVTIHNAAGNVSVTPGPDGKIGVQVTKRIADVRDAERILSGLQVTMTKGDNAVTIEAGATSATPAASTASATPSSASPAVDLALTVPVAAQLAAQIGTGTVTIQQIAGQMTVAVATGSIEAQDAVFAGSSQFTTGTGDVTLDGEMVSASLLGAQARTGTITLTLPAPFSGHLDARTQAGTVTVKGWSVPVSPVDGTGQQAVGDMRQESSDYITLRVTTGNIVVAPR